MALTRFDRRLSARAAWLAAAVLLAPAAWRGWQRLASAGPLSTGESVRVAERLRSDFDSPLGDGALIVLSNVDTTGGDFAWRRRLREMLTPMARIPGVSTLVSPATSLDTLLTSHDRRTALALVGFDRNVPHARDSLAALVRRADRAPAPTRLRLTGPAQLLGDIGRAGARQTDVAEMVVLPATLIVAMLVFGWSALALVALAAGVTIVVTLGLAALLSPLAPPTLSERMVIPLIALALTIDYSVLLLRSDAAVTSRRTVWLAALVVAIGFLGLAAVPSGELRSAAVGGLLAAAVAAAVSTSWFGQTRSAGAEPAMRSWWAAWARVVVRHPLLVTLAAAVPLVALAGFAPRARLITPVDNWLPRGTESGDAIRELQRAHRGGSLLALQLLADLPDATPVFSASGWRAVQQLTATVRATPGVAAVRSVTTIGTGDRIVTRALVPDAALDAFVSRSGRAAVIDAIPDIDGNPAVVTGLVTHFRNWRNTSMPGGATITVGGLPALAVDFAATVRHLLPRVILLIAGATGAALLVAFRAPLIAIKAVILNVLVAAAALGVTVLVFQGPGGSVFPSVPLLAFAAVFGISMDYELFLVTAVSRARKGAGSESDAIVAGVSTSARTITRAAAVMATLFAGLALSPFRPLAMTGLTLAAALLIDVTLVRLALAPALLRIGGRWNWWPGPHWRTG